MKYSQKFVFSLTARSLHRFGMLVGLRVAHQLLTGRGTFSILLPGYSHLILVRGGTSDVETFEKVFIREEYKHDSVGAKFIIDLGSNVGYSALFFDRMYPGAQIYCVEPENSNFEILKKNTEHRPNIVPINAAVWSTKTQLVIKDTQSEKWATQVTPIDSDNIVLFPSAENDFVDTITIPDILSMAKKEEIDILKIDIESAEKELFLSGTEPWLGKVRVLVIELHDQLESGCSMAFYRAVSLYDFDQFINGENIFLLRTSGAKKSLEIAA